MLWIYFFQYQKGTDKNLPLSMSYHLCKPIQILFKKKSKNNKCRTPISR